MAALSVGVVHQPAVGEEAIGDAYCVLEREDFVLVAAIDGLGHGIEAQEAAHRAIATIEAHPELTPKQLLERLHDALRGTRGAVAAIARLEHASKSLIFAGLGNIEARLVSATKTYRPMSVNGIVGHHTRSLRQDAFPYEPGDLLILHSDGISDRFELTARARERDPQMLANQIAHAHGRAHDDQLLLILRVEP